MRDAGHRTPDAGHRTAKKAKIIYPPPRGVDIITHSSMKQFPPKSNPIQAINPMNLHTKFQKARLNSIP